jgi:ABC-type Fe3+ transport system substrate-binding protein
MIRWIAGLFALLWLAPGWAQDRSWEKQWNETLAAARKEGKVVVMGSADPAVRTELPAAFKARFGIPLEYIGARGSDNYMRLSMEKRAGVSTVDAVMSGLSNMVDSYNEKIIGPLFPALMLPEVLDGSKWKRGKLWFLDPEERYILRLYNYVLSAGYITINTQHVKPEEFRSIKDLLNPKWQGKFSVYDPTVSGTGEIDAARFYKDFGEEFVRRLYIDQKPGISNNKRQLADWVARGTYPISLGVESEGAATLKEQGLPVEVIGLPDVPGYLTAGNGLLALIDKSPRPNAAKVFVNWIASREGLEVLARGRKKPTTRRDVDESFVLPLELPREGARYFDTYDWEFTVHTRDKIRKRVTELLKQGS